MIRPSSLSRARVCPKSAALSEQFPEGNEHTERGNEVDKQVTAALRHGGSPPPTDADALACWNWAVSEFDEQAYLIQEKVTLCDPETGDVLSEGTPDLQIVTSPPSGNAVITIDWKKREQWALGRLQHPDVSDQLHTYSLARALATEGCDRYVNIIVLFGGGEIEVLRSREYLESEWWPFIEGVKALNARKPDAIVGPHCGDCYSRVHCSSWQVRTTQALALLPQVTALTPANAAEFVQRIRMVEEAVELAKDLAKGYVNAGGVVEDGGKVWRDYPVAGRRSGPSVADLEKQGLGHLVKDGKPGVRWEWRKVRP